MSGSHLFALVLIGTFGTQPIAMGQNTPHESSGPESPQAAAVKMFATIDHFDKAQIEFALDYADEMPNVSSSAQFEILIGGKATPLVLDNETPVRERLRTAATNPQLKVYVCTEDTERLGKTLGAERVKLAAGVLEASCEQKVKQFLREKWMRVDVAAASR
jgi:hypothetical protein